MWYVHTSNVERGHFVTCWLVPTPALVRTGGSRRPALETRTPNLWLAHPGDALRDHSLLTMQGFRSYSMAPAQSTRSSRLPLHAAYARAYHTMPALCVGRSCLSNEPGAASMWNGAALSGEMQRRQPLRVAIGTRTRRVRSHAESRVPRAMP